MNRKAQKLNENAGIKTAPLKNDARNKFIMDIKIRNTSATSFKLELLKWRALCRVESSRARAHSQFTSRIIILLNAEESIRTSSHPTETLSLSLRLSHNGVISIFSIHAAFSWYYYE